jgi:hypothetical protein
VYVLVSEVLIAVNTKVKFFWNITPSGSVEGGLPTFRRQPMPPSLGLNSICLVNNYVSDFRAWDLSCLW